MIPWDGEEMHEKMRDNEDDQCVNRTALAEDNGWCAACWRDIRRTYVRRLASNF